MTDSLPTTSLSLGEGALGEGALGDMASDTLVKTVFFKASRETVWAFLTESDKLSQWFHRSDADLESGRDYSLLIDREDGAADKVCWGKVIDMTPPSRLVYSFTFSGLRDVVTTVTWTLEEALGGTRLTLVHEGIGQAGDGALGVVTSLDAGWDQHFSKLRPVINALS